MLHRSTFASALALGLLSGAALFVGCAGTLDGADARPPNPNDDAGPAMDSGPRGDGGGDDVDGGGGGGDSGPARDAGRLPPTVGPLDAANVVYVGHSLIGFEIPDIMRGLTASAGVTHTQSVQMGAGGTIQLQWERPAEGEYARDALATGNFDTLITTEAIPLESNYQFSGTVEFAGRFYDLAQSARPGTRVYMYETWHYLTEPNWLAKIRADRALWVQIINEVNASRSGPEMMLLPGGEALARLIERVESGGVPGMSNRADLFRDDIHPNDAGFYFLACVHYATVYRRSPVGLTTMTTDRFGAPYTPPSAEVARIMQELAWEVVSTEPLAGVMAP